MFQKYYHGSGSFFLNDIVRLHEFAQDLSFYKCNSQKRDVRDFRKIVRKPSRQRRGSLTSSYTAAWQRQIFSRLGHG
jgi:hypothetical protein